MHVETAEFCSITSHCPDVEWGRICIMGPELARNSLLEDHLNSGRPWKYVMFLDSDIVPPLYALHKMLEMRADIVAAPCPLLLKEGIYWNVADKEGYWIPYHEKLPDEPFETPACGAGCILVKREVIDAMSWPYFKMEYQPKWENNGNAVKTGEDIYFSKKAVSLGFKIMVAPLIKCRHHNPSELTGIYKIIENQVKTGKVKKEKA